MESDVQRAGTDKRIRFKEYQCTYPGCNEGLKTKYNCLSHIWDIHLRHISNITESYKNLPDKEQARSLCFPYLRYVPNADGIRKRKPYDLPDTLINKVDFVPQNVQNPQQSPLVQPESSFYARSENGYNIKCIDSSDQSTNQTIFPHIESNIVEPLSVNSQQVQLDTQFGQSSNGIMVTPFTSQLLSLGNDFIRIYSISQNVKRLYVAGEIFAENGFLQRSDKRSKKDIKRISHALDTICKITGKSFKYVNEDRIRFGFIAQELKEVIPEAVKEDEDGRLSIDPLSLLPFIVESLKELQRDLKKVIQTETVVNLAVAVDNTMKVVNEVKSDNLFSFGPSSFVVPTAVILTFISAIVAIKGTFPFIWIFLVFASICYWASNQFAPNGTFTKQAITMNFILLNVFLVCVSASFLMGTALQLYLGVYVSLMLLLWGCSQTLNTSFLNFFIVSFSFCCLACWVVFMFQPTFSCSVSTPMKQNTKFREYLEYRNWNDVRFELVSDIPWNCFNPHLDVKGNKVKFVQGNKTTNVVVDPDTLSTDKIEVRMVCSTVPYKCNSYTIYQSID
ncbi:hypothetical protein ENUP19_0061G0116 [Entamoeba nuttalli]|uniref:Peptidase S74 domain-containing protein n=2 Tax=Entamoeba nuttalli TaxID=412467 RepID=K2GUH1_ENTNP|nr:hypothetical protein ENU1_156620 [Entamoeba nuttalli P19]EKE38698.1 hypothetical protein ENU1_156620 [Entamoeba nuttalli P19]|eukprot:XP_008858951.1 hypothetical protein ENU1_156620 [Entamoeba nuttalli P19]